MLPPLLLGIALVVCALLLTRWFATAPPGAVVRTARWTGIAALAAGGLFLLLTGRLAWAFAALAGLIPWGIRAMRAHAVYRGLRDTWTRMQGGKARPGNISRVETIFLRMVLDHDTGELSGEVLRGAFQGARLAELDFAQVMALRREVQNDEQSAQVLEAWLDRAYPDWRDADRRKESRTAAPNGSTMTRSEAFQVLGLSQGAGAKDIKEAHRRLMKQMHPDHGGSTYLAARINQARDLLLNS